MAAIERARFEYLLTTPAGELSQEEGYLQSALRSDVALATRARGQWMPDGTYITPLLDGPINQEKVVEILDLIRTNVMSQGYLGGKGLRPWVYNIESMFRMDNNAPWWGFEFETGYSSQEARAEVIGHVWDTWDNVVFDGEGEGSYCSEITFSPATREQMLDGTAPAAQFMKYLCSHEGTVNTGYSDVGTHWNYSHPAMRRAPGEVGPPNVRPWETSQSRAAQGVENLLNGTLACAATPELWLEYFGRSYLYGGFFVRGNGGSCYLEGKLFRTTYDFDQFQKYMRTCIALDKIAETYLALPLEDNGYHPNMICSNFSDVVERGADVVLVKDDRGYCSDDVNGSNRHPEDDYDDYGYSDISDDSDE